MSEQHRNKVTEFLSFMYL